MNRCANLSIPLWLRACFASRHPSCWLLSHGPWATTRTTFGICHIKRCKAEMILKDYILTALNILLRRVVPHLINAPSLDIPY